MCCFQGGHSLNFNLLKLSAGRDLWVKAYSCMLLHNSALLASFSRTWKQGINWKGHCDAATLDVVFTVLLGEVAHKIGFDLVCAYIRVMVWVQSRVCKRKVFFLNNRVKHMVLR